MQLIGTISWNWKSKHFHLEVMEDYNTWSVCVFIPVSWIWCVSYPRLFLTLLCHISLTKRMLLIQFKYSIIKYNIYFLMISSLCVSLLNSTWWKRNSFSEEAAQERAAGRWDERGSESRRGPGGDGTARQSSVLRQLTAVHPIRHDLPAKPCITSGVGGGGAWPSEPRRRGTAKDSV